MMRFKLLRFNTMSNTPTSLLLLLAACSLTLWSLRADEPPADPSEDRVPVAKSMVEARSRARLLYEMVSGSLQVMHRDFFNEETSHTIPSASLETVFDELADSFDVDLKWLVVETDVVNVDHQPEDEFERAAVKSLKQGSSRFERVEENRYRFAGPIRLASQCLKCHVKSRTNTEDRTAGLLISMPIDLPIVTATPQN